MSVTEESKVFYRIKTQHDKDYRILISVFQNNNDITI